MLFAWPDADVHAQCSSRDALRALHGHAADDVQDLLGLVQAAETLGDLLRFRCIEVATTHVGIELRLGRARLQARPLSPEGVPLEAELMGETELRDVRALTVERLRVEKRSLERSV